jgi:hypothetical protein
MRRIEEGGQVDRWTGGPVKKRVAVHLSTCPPVHHFVWALLFLLLGAPARAQSGILVQGIADAEGWFTNNSSNLLTKNGGRPAGLLRLDLWGAAEPVHGLVFYAEGKGETGPSVSGTTTTTLWGNQLGVRYATTPAFVVDVGKMAPIIGTFAPRHFSTRNPLIGTPDGYTLQYPFGAKVSGRAGMFDYRVAMVSLPTTHVGYQPEPTPRLRPALGGGITPIVGLRLGGSFTVGSYLNEDDSLSLPAGTTWHDFHQRVAAFDASYAVGYLETHVEAARGTYDIPTGGSITGFTYYGEMKYTFTPRFFLAGRVERNDYPFIRAATTPGGTYAGRLTDFVDGEIGGGYRITASQLLKLSVRGDRWWVRPGAGFRGQGGHAIAIQLSQAFDLTDLIDRHE